MNTPIIDTDAAWSQHVERVLAGRNDDPKQLSGSDLHACGYALHQRVHGVPQLAHDAGSFANFERGHAYEARITDCLQQYAESQGFTVTHGRVVEYRGIVGHLDWTLERKDYPDFPLATIDLSTTALSKPDWKYPHALKSAFYTVAIGAEEFCEWVFCIGVGGKIVAQQAHWFSVHDDFKGHTWRERVHFAIDHAKWIAALPTEPEAVPPTDPIDDSLETWRCGKIAKNGARSSFCRARCAYNIAYQPEEVPA